jgi:hypothetical protein
MVRLPEARISCLRPAGALTLVVTIAPTINSRNWDSRVSWEFSPPGRAAVSHPWKLLVIPSMWLDSFRIENSTLSSETQSTMRPG